MTILNISFNYEGKAYKLKACLKNDDTLSNSKQNQATDISEDFGDDKRWSLFFEDFDNEHDIEVMMFKDDYSHKTMEADYAIIWGKGANGVIEDEIDVTCQVKYQ